MNPVGGPSFDFAQDSPAVVDVDGTQKSEVRSQKSEEKRTKEMKEFMKNQRSVCNK